MNSNYFGVPCKETTKAFGMIYDTKADGDGPLKVSIPDHQFLDIRTIHHSWDKVNTPRPREGFAEPFGHYWPPKSINKDMAVRNTSRNAYYKPIVSRTNLKLLTKAHVDEILLSKDKFGALTATGVKYTPKNAK